MHPARRAAAYVTAATVALLTAAVGCHGRGQAPATGLTIALINDFRGFERPCGCAQHQVGGLLRLGTVMSAVQAWLADQPIPSTSGAHAAALLTQAAPATLARPQPVVMVDCGNFAWFDSPSPELRARTHLAVLKLLGGAAVVPGGSELQLSEAQARAFLGESPLPVVSCNLSVRGKDIAVQPYAKLAAGWYLIGVSCWEPTPGEPPQDRWWDLSDPVQGVRETLSQLPRAAKVVVVAAHQPPDVLSKLAGLKVVAVVGGAADVPARGAGGAPIVPEPPSIGGKLVLLSLARQAEGPAVQRWAIETTDEWPDDTRVDALLKDEQQRLREEMLAKVRTRGDWRSTSWGMSAQFLPSAAPAGGQYVGAMVCATCHAAAYKTWQASGHSQALQSLKAKGDEGSVDCLKCHTTAMVEPGGYDPLSPRAELGSVGCESCHGAGGRHVELMRAAKKPTGELAIARGSLDKCVSCHDSYNSPGFERTLYWEKIRHSR